MEYVWQIIYIPIQKKSQFNSLVWGSLTLVPLIHQVIVFSSVLSIIQRSTFSDLTLSQPLDTVARLCCYASPQLHDHISMFQQSHAIHWSWRLYWRCYSCSNVPLFTQAVSMMEKTGFSASGIEPSITVYTLAPCIAKTIIFNWKGLSHEYKGIILAVAWVSQHPEHSK